MGKPPEGFYVYELIDPRTMKAFYVGKGKGDRMHHHLRDSRTGRVRGKAKHQRIMDILAAGHQPIAQVIAEYDLESDAFEHEIELIATRDGLVNVGRGGEGRSLTPAQVAEQRQARKARLDAVALVRMREDYQRHGAFIASQKSWGPMHLAMHMAAEAILCQP